jgi:hypothetical protein
MEPDIDPNRCAHAPCTCSAPAGELYCSEHCEQAQAASSDSVTAGGCGCGHPGCGS